MQANVRQPNPVPVAHTQFRLFFTISDVFLVVLNGVDELTPQPIFIFLLTLSIPLTSLPECVAHLPIPCGKLGFLGSMRTHLDLPRI